MNFEKSNALPLFDKIICYLEDVLPEHSKMPKQVVIYCEPVGVRLSNSGEILEYKVIRIFDITEYLKGDKTSTCKEIVYTSKNIPGNLKKYLDTMYRMNNI